jgi:phage-related protein
LEQTRNPLHFVRESRDDLRKFPEDVRYEIGFSLNLAELGDKALNAVPLIGFGNAGVLEIVADYDGDTYRCVYTVRLPFAVYVLHAFQKKAKKGRKTPHKEMNLVRSRLKDAEKHHQETYEKEQRAKGGKTRAQATRSH